MDWLSKLVDVLEPGRHDSHQKVVDYLMGHRKNPQPHQWGMQNSGLKEEEIKKYMELKKVRSRFGTCR